ncbi:MAG TPA: hypothetical protein PKD99_15025 [Sphingopyxis sp.]|nr:hypothetical protein [Sphingopyxis sp.]HMP46411.1 hypothetical protein [Sphingopyxis sp.]
MLQLSPVPATPYVEQLNIGVGRRTLALSLAVLIPAIMLLMLLTFGGKKPPDNRQTPVSVVRLEAAGVSADAPQPSDAAPERSETPPLPPPPPQPAAEEPLPPPVIEPKVMPTTPAPVERPPAPPAPPSNARPPGAPVYGPPNTGASSAYRDTEQVGTAPNGEPLYAAAWYREPRDDELRGYLSTASGPGWGLIACRTAPDYRVEDCVGLDEYPNGSQINRAVLAAAWQFRVRPPRRGGRLMVGAWVRIRIDYGIERR